MSNKTIQGKAILTAGVIIINDEKVLLIRNTVDSKHPTNTYGIPAGRVEEHEEPLDAAIRETKEEVGLLFTPSMLKRLPQIYYAQLERKDGRKTYAQIVYYTSHVPGTPHAGDKAEPVWVPLNHLDRYEIVGNLDETIEDVVNSL